MPNQLHLRNFFKVEKEEVPRPVIKYAVDLCHFGEDCAPGIIINDILNQKDKLLFMLGNYRLNDILFYLKDGNYEKIYDKEDLIILPNNHVKHRTYNFVFNHEYRINRPELTNYEFVRNRFDLKITNFRTMLSSQTMCIFIVFTENVDQLNLTEMLEWLSINKKNFHLMIFTSTHFNTVSHSKFCSILKLTKDYTTWYKVCCQGDKIAIYKEIYDKFINCLNQRNIQHDFPLEFRM